MGGGGVICQEGNVPAGCPGVVRGACPKPVLDYKSLTRISEVRDDSRFSQPGVYLHVQCCGQESGEHNGPRNLQRVIESFKINQYSDRRSFFINLLGNI